MSMAPQRGRKWFLSQGAKYNSALMGMILYWIKGIRSISINESLLRCLQILAIRFGLGA